MKMTWAWANMHVFVLSLTSENQVWKWLEELCVCVILADGLRPSTAASVALNINKHCSSVAGIWCIRVSNNSESSSIIDGDAVVLGRDVWQKLVTLDLVTVAISDKLLSRHTSATCNRISVSQIVFRRYPDGLPFPVRIRAHAANITYKTLRCGQGFELHTRLKPQTRRMCETDG